MSIVNPLCPTGCNSILPQAASDLCDPKVLFGEIEKIYISSGDSAAFSDWTDIDEWTARIDNSDTVDINKIREFHVVADLPQATADELTISLGRKVFTPATHTINFDIDDISAENYEFGRTTSCNVLFRVWFATKSKLFGGNDGILANVNIRPVIERGIKSINKLVGTVSWEYQFSPESTDNILEGANFTTNPTVASPVIVSSETPNSYSVKITFDKAMNNPLSFLSDFSLLIDGNPSIPAAVYLDPGDNKSFIVEWAGSGTESTVHILSIVSGNITAVDGGIMAAVSGYTVTNTLVDPKINLAYTLDAHDVVVTFTPAVVIFSYEPAEFTLKINGTPATIVSVSDYSGGININITENIVEFDDVMLSVNSTNIVSTAQSVYLPVITDFSVTNSL